MKDRARGPLPKLAEDELRKAISRAELGSRTSKIVAAKLGLSVRDLATVRSAADFTDRHKDLEYQYYLREHLFKLQKVIQLRKQVFQKPKEPPRKEVPGQKVQDWKERYLANLRNRERLIVQFSEKQSLNFQKYSERSRQIRRLELQRAKGRIQLAKQRSEELDQRRQRVRDIEESLMVSRRRAQQQQQDRPSSHRVSMKSKHSKSETRRTRSRAASLSEDDIEQRLSQYELKLSRGADRHTKAIDQARSALVSKKEHEAGVVLRHSRILEEEHNRLQRRLVRKLQTHLLLSQRMKQLKAEERLKRKQKQQQAMQNRPAPKFEALPTPSSHKGGSAQKRNYARERKEAIEQLKFRLSQSKNELLGRERQLIEDRKEQKWLALETKRRQRWADRGSYQAGEELRFRAEKERLEQSIARKVERVLPRL